VCWPRLVFRGRSVLAGARNPPAQPRSSTAAPARHVSSRCLSTHSSPQPCVRRNWFDCCSRTPGAYRKSRRAIHVSQAPPGRGSTSAVGGRLSVIRPEPSAPPRPFRQRDAPLGSLGAVASLGGISSAKQSLDNRLDQISGFGRQRHPLDEESGDKDRRDLHRDFLRLAHTG